VNTKEYIESGILEAYVLGALPENERAAVAANIAMYPDLAQEVASIEAAMQELAEATPVAPPAFMQEKIWEAISVQGPSEDAMTRENGATKVIPMVTPMRGLYATWQWAAVMVIMVGSLLANLYFINQRSGQAKRLSSIERELNTMQQSQAQMEQTLAMYRSEREMMADSMVETVVMKSVQPGHPMAATIYWDKAKKETYLAMKKLPMPDAGMQYQMWVIQDGKPVSMGVIPNDIVESGAMARLPMEISSGQAFAISLEKEGGNPTPTQVMVLGKTAS
jgi:anti-sigma-K factor RskA